MYDLKWSGVPVSHDGCCPNTLPDAARSEASTQSFSICNVQLHAASSGLGGFQLAELAQKAMQELKARSKVRNDSRHNAKKASLANPHDPELDKKKRSPIPYCRSSGSLPSQDKEFEGL